ncbi:unnamed protein product [Cochlearia groenlandica]
MGKRKSPRKLGSNPSSSSSVISKYQLQQKARSADGPITDQTRPSSPVAAKSDSPVFSTDRDLRQAGTAPPPPHAASADSDLSNFMETYLQEELSTLF